MPSIKTASNVRMLFPDVTAAVEQYRQAKPDRDARNLARRLSNEEAMYDQFMQKLTLVAGRSRVGGGGEVINQIERRLGCEAAESLRADLQRMEDFLHALKADLVNASRGTEVLVRLRRKTTNFRSNIPKTPLQRRLDELSEVNRRLSAYLEDDVIQIPTVTGFKAALEYRILFHQNQGELVNALRITGARLTCLCRERETLHHDIQSPLFSGDPGEKAISQQQSFAHISVLFCELKGANAATWLTQHRKTPVYAEKGQHNVKTEQRDKRVLAFHIEETSLSPTMVRFEDLIKSSSLDFGRTKRVELAFRLSSAVLLLWSASWISSSLKWRDWTISLDVHPAGDIRSFSLSPRSIDQQNAFGKKANGTALPILDRERVLTLLGLRLIELAFGQTFDEIRQQDATLHYEETNDRDLNYLLTAKRMLNSRRISAEFGEAYEAVVHVCIYQQYREPKGAQVKDLNFGDPAFLESASVAILLPLYQEVQRSFGCPCLSGHLLKETERPGGSKPDPQGRDYGKIGQKENFTPSIPQHVAAPATDEDTNEASFQILPRADPPDSPSGLSVDDTSDDDANVNGTTQVRSDNAVPLSVGSDGRSHGHMGVSNVHMPTTEQAHSRLSSPPDIDTLAIESLENVEANGLPSGRMQLDAEAAPGTAHMNTTAGISQLKPPSQRVSSPSRDLGAASEYSYDTMTATTDSAFAWLSDYTDDPPSMPRDHPLLLFKDVALRIFLRGFQTWRGRGSGPSEASGSIHQSRSSTKRTWGQPGKDHTADDGEGENSSMSPSVSNKKRRVKEDKLSLGCPFFKKDAMAHHRCGTYVLTRIRDVKQHLTRRHQMPIYCPRCIQTFDDESARDSHVRDTFCEQRPYGQLEGITEQQKKHLTRKAPANQSEEEQWYGIFDILFPNHSPRPGSPYVDPDLLQNVVGFQSFLTSHGPRILGDLLTNHGAVTWNLPDGDSDVRAFQQRILEEGIQTICAQWMSHGVAGLSNIRTTEASTGGHHDSSQRRVPEHPTPAASLYTDQQQSPDTRPSFSLASSYVPSEISWGHDGDWLANLNLDGTEDTGLDPITPSDRDEINKILSTHADLRNHVRYPHGE
ncbi:hypothetical protein JX265_005340 [Neoarthrinium moseri]|uniref:Uncharacterized protein n=1 Tax=Neoarthrinium moseri TaxID=1658444 RepID=A0A9P9WNB2_9PEZI|nr:hypothetical protein JX265_005340 [Neoarthrinium moseri]